MRKTSVLAIIGLVLGVLGFVSGGLLGIIGLILSIIALVSIGRSQGRLGGSGIAIAGIVTSGLSVVLGCLAIGILLPAIGQARMMARNTIDLANAKNASVFIDTYIADHTGRYPPTHDWADLFVAELGSDADRALRSTFDPEAGRALAMNAQLDGLNSDDVPGMTVLLFECAPGSPPAGGPELLAAKPRFHLGHVVAFTDGSVRNVPDEEVHSLRWDPGGR